MSVSRKTTTHWVLNGKRVGANTPGAHKVKHRSKKWWGLVGGDKVPLAANRAAAIQLLAAKRREWEDRDSPASQIRAAQKVPTSEHVAEFVEEVRLGGKKGPPGKSTVEGVALCLVRLFGDVDTLGGIGLAAARDRLERLARPRELPPLPEGQEAFTAKEACALTGTKPATLYAVCRNNRLPRCGGRGRAVRYPRVTVEALLRLHRDSAGHGPASIQRHVRVARRFTRWLVRRGKLSRDPLADLEAPSPEDCRHQRRPLSQAEVALFLETARASARVVRGLTGEARHALYLTALSTGFHRGELASLTPASFALDATPPVVRLARAVDKARRKVEQPIPAQVVPTLKGHLAGRDPDSPVWPGSWPLVAAAMLRRDLESAGIPYAIKGPDGPLYADFHALRHTFVAILDRAGLTLKQAMQLARHSSPQLTAKVYGRADLAELSAAADRVVFARLFASPDATEKVGGDRT